MPPLASLPVITTHNAVAMYDIKWWLILMHELCILIWPSFQLRNSISGRFFLCKMVLVANFQVELPLKSVQPVI